jgi:hypothetical protein
MLRLSASISATAGTENPTDSLSPRLPRGLAAPVLELRSWRFLSNVSLLGAVSQCIVHQDAC